MNSEEKPPGPCTLDQHITWRVWLIGRVRGLIEGTITTLLGQVAAEHGLSHLALKNCLSGRSSWTRYRKDGSYAVEKIARALHIDVSLLIPTRSREVNLYLLGQLAPELTAEDWSAPNAYKPGAYRPAELSEPSQGGEITLASVLSRLTHEQLADTVESSHLDEEVVREVVRRLREGDQFQGLEDNEASETFDDGALCPECSRARTA